MTTEYKPHLELPRVQAIRREIEYTTLDGIAARILSLEEQFETLRGIVDELGAYFDFDSLHPDFQDRISGAMEDSIPADEPGLLDTAEGRAISDAADEANAEGEAHQEELQRLRDSQSGYDGFIS